MDIKRQILLVFLLVNFYAAGMEQQLSKVACEVAAAHRPARSLAHYCGYPDDLPIEMEVRLTADMRRLHPQAFRLMLKKPRYSVACDGLWASLSRDGLRFANGQKWEIAKLR